MPKKGTKLSSRRRRDSRLRSLVIACGVSIVVAVGALIYFAANAATVTYYVSPSGSDANTGTSASAPFKTIQRAMDLAQPGAVINLAEGVYTGKVTTKVAGTSANPITLQGPETGKDINGRYKAVVYGTGGHVIDINHSYYTLKGFTVDGQKAIARGEYPTTPANIRGFKDSVQSRAVNSKLVYVGAANDSRDIVGTRIDDMFLQGSGGECVRFRNNAMASAVSRSVIQWCGMYGAGDDSSQYKYHNAEGVYVGTSPKSTTQPMYANDTSNGILVTETTIRTFGSECFNVKENAHHNIIQNSECMYNDEPIDYNGSNIEFRGDNNRVENTVVDGSRGYSVKFWSDSSTYDKGGNAIRLSALKNSAAAAISVKQAVAQLGEICGNTFAANGAIQEANNVGDPAKACADTKVGIQAPSGLTVQSSTSTEVKLGWTAPGGAVSAISYNVYRNDTKIGNVTDRAYTSSELTGGTAYSYYVKAVDAAGTESLASNVVNVTTPASPTTQNINFEAETGALVSPMAAHNDPSAQGGKYVAQLSGSGTGRVTYTFNVTTAGSYTLKGRVIAPTSSSNSFSYAFDTASRQDWNLTAGTTSWTWATGPTVSLTAGKHTLTLYKKENGTKVDALSLTANTAATAPTAPGAITATSLFEAEAGAESGGIVEQSETGASGGKYVIGKSSGTATYNIQVPTNGTYMIAGYIKAASGNADSFNVKFDSGTYAMWDLQEPSTSWVYDATNNPKFTLTAGTHTMTLQYREAGSMVDRIVLIRQ
ncbi:hypothetical protein JNJ66_00145 [Candidatus Saccharibacteria bacterium]|nr:hypothetical protein [Candidatus Saccharibacteria bacterium]